MGYFEDEVEATRRWLESDRFAETTRLYSARQVVEQRGAVLTDYPVARNAADRFYSRLRELFARRQSITTFGPYSPGQAVAMKRAGIEAIYLGGWATSAKGSARIPARTWRAIPSARCPTRPRDWFGRC